MLSSGDDGCITLHTYLNMRSENVFRITCVLVKYLTLVDKCEPGNVRPLLCRKYSVHTSKV